MTLQKITKLHSAWANQGIFAAVEAALADIGFDDAYVDGAISKQAITERSKVIKDGVWGMIEVSASHLRLLDCPILQRLRTIHQLGFSYLTYPSAEHSRFAHSLGMFSVVSRFLQEMRQRPPEQATLDSPYQDWRPSDKEVMIAEHAAILHDIGHLPFSHVSEQIFQGHSEEFHCGPISVDEFTFTAEDIISRNKLAELLSVAIVLTPRFRKFYKGFIDLGSSDDVPFRIACLILGLEPQPELAGVANLGFRLNHSQNATRVARATADRKFLASLS